MQLVEATEDDVDTIADYWYSLATEMERYSELNTLVYEDASAVPSDGFRRQLADEAFTHLLVQTDATETVGFVSLREGRHPSREYSRCLQIVDLFVDEDHRNEGYGTETIERVVERARERGCDHVEVSFEVGNEGARRLYDETGFEAKQLVSVHTLE